MRNLERSVLIHTLCFGLAAGGLVIACSSSDSGGGTDDGGLNTDETGASSGSDGAAPGDGAAGDATAPIKCVKPIDCPSGICNQTTGLCSPASCKDGVKNGTESDVDCGGSCAKCDMLKSCAAAGDCTSGVCKNPDGKGLKCQPPSNTDLVKNGNETGVDCGGTGNPPCADGQGCVVRGDCASKYCKATVCTAVKPDDGVQDGDETDVDCGGPGGAKPCADGLMCGTGTDCASLVCTGGVCQVPTYTDGKQNGVETDVDCGGDPAHPCVTAQSCKVGGDCTTGGCDYNFKCAAGRSCTAHYGGDTCGAGGAGGLPGLAASWESCCTTIPVTTAAGGTVYMDKYPVTSGRMRAFLEDPAVQYNVRGAVQALRAADAIPTIPVTTSGAVDGVHPVLDPSWDPFLPTGFGATAAGEISDCPQSGTCTLASGECPASTTCVGATQQDGIYTSVRNHLGGNIFKNNSQTSTGCYVGSPGTHSYRFPDAQQDGSPAEWPQDVYDTKTLNCVDYLMAQAFCVWDGGRLETFPEWQTAYGPGSTPWGPADTRTPVSIGSSSYYGCRFPTATDSDQTSCSIKWGPGVDNRTNQLADYQYSFEYPNLKSVDYIVFLTPPGRTAGRGPLGHADLLGAGFELTSSVTWSAWNPAVPNSGPFAARHHWSGNGSWEVHDYNRAYTGTSELLNKYGKLGARCVKFANTN